MQMKDNEVFPPVVIDHAKGVYLYDTEDKPYLDIISSWWCNLLGHCNPEINEALKRQIDTLEHVIFTNFSHKPAIELSRELAELLPKGLTKFTYHDNGSSAVEAAMKMAYQYHNQTGHPERQKFMCLDSSYHGETIGALPSAPWTTTQAFSIRSSWTISISKALTATAARTARQERHVISNASKAQKKPSRNSARKPQPAS